MDKDSSLRHILTMHTTKPSLLHYAYAHPVFITKILHLVSNLQLLETHVAMNVEYYITLTGIHDTLCYHT